MDNFNLNNDDNENNSDSVSEDSSSQNATETIPFPTFLNSNFNNPDSILDTNPNPIIINRRRGRLNNIMNFFTRDHLHTLRTVNETHIRGISRMGRRRFRNFGHDLNSNSDAESENPQNNEDYVDFRLYPLNLDWKDVENESSIAYDLLKTYGQVGLSLYTSLKNFESMENLTINNFFLKIIDKFANVLDQHTLIKEEFFEALPKLNTIRELIYKNLTKTQDIIPIKIILDVYEHYYKKFDYPLHQNYIKEFIPTAILFYSNLKRSDLKLICESYHIEMKKIKLFDVVLYTRKQQYLTHYKKLKAELIQLKHGLQKTQFII